LLQMSKELIEELVFPSSELHFACDRASIWVGAQDVEGDAAQEGKILRAVILAGARIVLVEDDIELPVQLIFHAPVRARHLQQAFGRQLSGRHHVVHRVGDRKSTRLNSSHLVISYAVFCLKKKISII